MRRNRLTYGVVVLILFIFILLRDASMTYTAFYAVLALPLFSVLVALISKRKIEGRERLNNDYIAKYETTEYKVEIRNHGFLPCFFVCLKFDFEEIGLNADVSEVYLSLKPFSSEEKSVKISGKYRGIYEVGVKEIFIYDFLGLFKFKLQYEKELKLTIMPQMIKIPELLSEVTQEGETIIKRHMQGKDYTISAELREFQPTDSYKQIHWKATAKRNEFISKNPQEIEQLATVFFVNNLRIASTLEKMLAREDKMMDVVVSAMSHCHHLGHRMSFHALHWGYHEFTMDFTRLYHDASMLPFGDFGKIHHVLNDYLNSGNTLENVYLFTQVVDKDLMLSLQGFKLLGSNMTVFLFGHVTEGTLKKLESVGIRYICFN